MKTIIKYKNVAFVILLLSVGNIAFHNVYSQNHKKNKVRIQAYYFKIMDSISFVDIRATSKIDKKTKKLPNLAFDVYNFIDESEIKLGSINTNQIGETKFILKDLETLKKDSLGYYNIKITFKGNEQFKKSSKTITFKDAEINTKLSTKDSINFINATLIDKNSNSAIASTPLIVRVQRLFKPLILGDSFNMTDDDGRITSAIDNNIPGVNRNIYIEVVLDDSDEYGTVIDVLKAPIGVPIVDESTFDKRTMWSPRNKTPLFLLIVPNALTFGMWFIIALLIINLFKIKKA